MSKTYLVTGAQGCIGAWVTRHLLERGDRPVLFDQVPGTHRLDQILPPEDRPALTQIQGDVCSLEEVVAAIESSGATRVIHLAGMQVPGCQADPVAGARVNVLGTIQVFEAAVRAGVERVAYASSAAVYGPGAMSVGESDPSIPTTHYGVFKLANEGNARIYYKQHGLHSVGLRPLTVYGVGRDQGLTSDITKAMKAAVIGRDFRIRFGGSTDVIHAGDVAHALVAAADGAPAGAHVFNLHGATASIESIVALIAGLSDRPCIDFTDEPLPMPSCMQPFAIDAALPGLPRTPIATGVRRTMDAFRALLAEGRLPVEDLDS